jgi:anhydro-N-acetylmuramic acid kinase
MIVAGVMSGTSADGVDVALCRIGPGAGKGDPPRVKLIGHLGTPYPKAVRAEVLRVMEGEALPAAQMSRLNWRVGGIYADCVDRTAAKFGVRVQLAGCHGQTVHHQATPLRFLGAPVRSTWQIGEAAVVAERLRCPVVSDFRPADLAAGGQGAPLVPMLDWCMFRDAKKTRVLQNLGGIGNLTALPAGCGVDRVLAFDTGPGNMVIDHCMQQLYGQAFDRDGAVARRGQALRKVVAKLMRERYFSALPPKSCGREQFGADFATRLIGMCRNQGGSDADCVATATALTAESILDAYRRFVRPHLDASAPGPTSSPLSQKRESGCPARLEFYAAGGGARNRTLMTSLRAGFAALGVEVRSMDELGVPAQAKEAVAFALLAWLTWNRLAGNVPAATGANRAVVLGKVSYGC